MDNAVYGLTKGQSSPTAAEGLVTSSTPYGKPEDGLNALSLYLTVGASFVASGLSSKIKDLADLIYRGMSHRGFSVVHVQSPCTEYNNTYEQLKGNVRKGIKPLAWDIPEEHPEDDIGAAFGIVGNGGVPLGVLYRDEDRSTFHERVTETTGKARVRTVEEMIDFYSI